MAKKRSAPSEYSVRRPLQERRRITPIAAQVTGMRTVDSATGQEITDDEMLPFEPSEDLCRQADLLARWKVFGRELRRRAEYPLPFDLALELHDLIDETPQ
jgi:hypothetical protein